MKIKRLYLDIETSMCIGWFWSTGKQYVGPEQVLEPSRIICISYMWEGEKKPQTITWDNKKSDMGLLKKLQKVISDADEVVGHNVARFDLRHIAARLAYHNLPPLDTGKIQDTLLTIRKKLRLPSYKLDYLCTYFGLGNKAETGGAGLWLDIVLRNDRQALKKMVKYCEHDVALTQKLHERTKTYVDQKTNLAAVCGKHVCPSCGGGLQKHGTRMVTPLKKVQRYRCKKCCKVSHDGVNLLKNTPNIPRG